MGEKFAVYFFLHKFLIWWTLDMLLIFFSCCYFHDTSKECFLSKQVLNFMHRTDVHFGSFLFCGFITAIVVIPPERKLAKRTSVHWFKSPILAIFHFSKMTLLNPCMKLEIFSGQKLFLSIMKMAIRKNVHDRHVLGSAKSRIYSGKSFENHTHPALKFNY